MVTLKRKERAGKILFTNNKILQRYTRKDDPPGKLYGLKLYMCIVRTQELGQIAHYWVENLPHFEMCSGIRLKVRNHLYTSSAKSDIKINTGLLNISTLFKGFA